MTPPDRPEIDPADHADATVPLLLLVEDNPDISNVIAELLTGMGYGVLTATSGEAALSLMGQHTIPLAIVDQALPGMPGPVFVARARANRPELRAIYISGAPIEDHAQAAGDPVLLKPFRAAQLQAMVTALLPQ